MFARCLLGRPGTGRQDPVLTSLRLAGLRYSSACRGIPMTQVFKKLPLSSGLLIRGFGVRVPGGAPVLDLGFYRSRSLTMCPFCLRGCSPARIQQSWACQEQSTLRRSRGYAPRHRAAVSADAAPTQLGQWSRPLRRLSGTCPESLCQCRHAALYLLVIGTLT